MSRISAGGLRGVSETLLLPLYYRVIEHSRADALVHDGHAAQIVRRLDYELSRVAGTPAQQKFAVLRTCQFDRCAQSFLARHPQGGVAEIGFGLDTRSWRADNGQVEWFDLGLPPVIRLRRQLLDEEPRCHFGACSVLDFGWTDIVRQAAGRHFLLLAEGVSPYWEVATVRRFVLGVGAHLDCVELIFDAMPAHVLWLHNFQLAGAKLEGRLHWELRHSRVLEGWVPGIRRTGEWTYFDRLEPRLGWLNHLRTFTPISRPQMILRYAIDGQGHGPISTQDDEQPAHQEQEHPAYA
jgi:O-methyltransferase involved in polyketide biosynthesis